MFSEKSFLDEGFTEFHEDSRILLDIITRHHVQQWFTCLLIIIFFQIGNALSTLYAEGSTSKFQQGT